MAAPRRVFISHTSEFTTYPEKESFIDAAIAAVNRVRAVPYDMEYFGARDQQPAQYCKERVRECDVYVGVIGLRYGSPVRDRPELSYTELEFEAASEGPSKTRLVFLLNPDAEVPAKRFTDGQFADRQEQFRTRLRNSGVTCQDFRNVHELEKLIYQALIEAIGPAEAHRSGQERIEWPEGTSPYPGLLSFDERYAPLFFGRDREVDAVLAKMSEPDGRFLIVSGASGSGKSSLVAAGVWRALKEGRLKGSAQWPWLRIQPGDGQGPFDPLVWSLKQAFPRIAKRAQDLANELAGSKTPIGELLAPQLAQGQELVLYIDQLEELFTQSFKEQELRNFLEQLVATTRDTQSRLRVVATVRSEFIARLEESEAVLQVLNAGYNYHLGPVSPRILQDMIEKPAKATGYEFETGLVEDILRDAAQEPGSLPLVSYALKQLFERRRGRTFTHEAYRSIGGVVGAIGTQADQVMDGLGEQAPGAFDKVFAELVHLEREPPPTRKRATLTVFNSNEGATRLIHALAGPDCRVLVTGGDGLEATVEVAHEKLFTAWPKLKNWINSAGEDLRLIDYAEEAARRWHKTGGHLQELWRKERAEAIQNALTRFNKKPSPLLEDLLRPQQMLKARLDQEGLSHEDRLLIGKKLAEFGDPRRGVGLSSDGLPDIDWVEIPPGRIKLEDNDHVFEVKAFRMARYPVTNVQFEAFIKAGDGYHNEEWWKGIQPIDTPNQPSWQEPNGPRETVSWFEAVAFCRWLSARTEAKIRLPTEWEWQQAATGGDPSREYPWPGGWDPSRCNASQSRLNRTTAVGMYPGGATQQGLQDMLGNLWEWCLNKYDKPGQAQAILPSHDSGQRVIRGGSWNYDPGNLRASFRLRNDADFRGGNVGFRLAQDIEK